MTAGKTDDRRREKEGCDRRCDVSDVLHHGARQADGAGSQRGFGDPGFAGLLDDVIGERTGVRLSHLGPPPYVP